MRWRWRWEWEGNKAKKNILFYVFTGRMTRAVGGKNEGSRQLSSELKQFKHDIG